MAMLKLALMGVFQAWIDETPLTKFRSRSERALLAYLAVEPARLHRRAHLAETLWPNRRAGVARNNLRQSIYNIRSVIQNDSANPPYLTITRHTIQFNPHSDHWLDVAEFRKQIAPAHSHCGLQSQDICETCARSLQTAIDLYRGEFLEGLDISGGNEFQEWLYVLREQLRRSQVGALQALTSFHYFRNALDQACHYAEVLLRLDPLQEAAHRQLMRVLAGMEQPQAALLQYQRCQELLSTELGVCPSVETQTLYQEIAAGKLRPDKLAAQVSPAAIPLRSPLPDYLTPFFGRKTEIRRLEKLLSDPTCRLLTLLGPGGVGKTRLALQVASEQVEKWQDGVWFIPLESLSGGASPDAFAGIIGQMLEIPIQPRQVHKQVKQYLAQRQSLLIFDNFEHLLNAASMEAADFLLAILKCAPQVKMIVTSRQRLNFQAEHLFDVYGLPYPICEWESCVAKFDFDACRLRQEEIGCGVDDPASYGAVQLFLERASRVRGDLRPSGKTLPPVVRICQLVEGHPLALELAAAWTRQHTCEQIARKIDASLDSLAVPLRDLPERQRSLRVVFEHSWSLLPPTEQELYRRLAVFQSGFTFEAARAVTSLSSPFLDKLLSKSLIHRSGGGRYDLHSLLRQYTAEKLAEDSTVESEYRQRHSHYYLAFLRGHEFSIYEQDSREKLTAIQGEMANIQAAWNCAIASKDIDLLAVSLEGFSVLYEYSGFLQEGEKIFRETDHQLQSLENDPPSNRLLCRIIVARASFLFKLGKYDQVIEIAQRAIEYGQVSGDREGIALGHLYWGYILNAQGQQASAREHFRNALFIARDVLAKTAQDTAKDTRLKTALHKIESNSLTNLALVSQSFGDYAEARAYLEQSLAIVINTGDRGHQATVLTNLGNMVSERGDYVAAMQYFNQSLEIRRAAGNLQAVAVTTINLGNIHLYLGQYEKARHHYAEAHQIQRELGTRQGEGYSLLNLGLLHCCQEEHSIAHQYISDAVKVMREVGDHSGEAITWMGLGHAFWGLGEFENAADSYQQAVEQLGEAGPRRMVSEARAGLARIDLFRENNVQAGALVEEILDQTGECENLEGLIDPFQVCLTCFQVLQAIGDPRAPRVLQRSYQELNERAANISADPLRRSFLENVKSHRTLERLWCDLGSSR